MLPTRRKKQQGIEEYEILIQSAGKDTNLDECIPVSYINLSKLYLESSNLQKAHKYIAEFHKNYPDHQMHFDHYT